MDRTGQDASLVAGAESEAAPPLLVGKQEAARLTGISPRSLDRLVSIGNFLPPTRLGGRVLWNRKALEQWVAAGCPDPGSKAGRADR